MFKIGDSPTPQANSVEHADYLELECLRKSDRKASVADLVASLNRLADDLPEDRADAGTRIEATVEEAFFELIRRSQHSGCSRHLYPFRVSEDSRLLEFVGIKGRRELYLFMLFATRMNMSLNRVQGGINGTELFEAICCEVAKNYWGERTDGMVFGTARRADDDEVGTFSQAVNALCDRMGEGIAFHSHSGYSPTAQDGNLDVVVWKRFSDQRQGQLIGFGQCKTGTHWESGLFELIPEGFCQKWVRTQPAVKPVRLFFMASRTHYARWYDAVVDSGILFDRCRILDYAPKMTDLRQRLLDWTTAALSNHGIPSL